MASTIPHSALIADPAHPGYTASDVRREARPAAWARILARVASIWSLAIVLGFAAGRLFGA